MPAIVVLCAAPALAQPEGDRISRLAREGWEAARWAASSGGTRESLQSATRVLAEIDRAVADSEWPLQGEYARSLVAAAMAAAQDERAEMELHLTHAQDLSTRLATSRYPAEWPLPFDEAAGELWFEVNEYSEALEAYQRAVASRPQPRSWLGLARSAARLKDEERACDAYRRVMQLSTTEQELQEARDYLRRCR